MLNMKDLLKNIICLGSFIVMALCFWMSTQMTYDQEARKLAADTSIKTEYLEQQTAILSENNRKAFNLFEQVVEKDQQHNYVAPLPAVEPRIEHIRY